jgi:hypothetical protein
MLASWVQQAAFEPPATIAIAKGRPIAKLIPAAAVAISIVPEDKSLMKRFAGRKGGEDPFAGVATMDSPGGVPILSDALGWRSEAGQHLRLRRRSRNPHRPSPSAPAREAWPLPSAWKWIPLRSRIRCDRRNSNCSPHGQVLPNVIL